MSTNLKVCDTLFSIRTLYSPVVGYWDNPEISKHLSRFLWVPSPMSMCFGRKLHFLMSFWWKRARLKLSSRLQCPVETCSHLRYLEFIDWRALISQLETATWSFAFGIGIGFLPEIVGSHTTLHSRRRLPSFLEYLVWVLGTFGTYAFLDQPVCLLIFEYSGSTFQANRNLYAFIDSFRLFLILSKNSRICSIVRYERNEKCPSRSRFLRPCFSQISTSIKDKTVSTD